MKFVFVAGLEHSGSTLTTHLLGQHPRVLGLGEVASYFSPTHMKHYMGRWGECPDAQLCSCGQTWQNCTFWADVLELNGLHSDWPEADKYRRLFHYIRSQHKDIEVVVDSSKNVKILDNLLKHTNLLGLDKSDIMVVFVAKDVRSFSASISKKAAKSSVIDRIRTFNLWYSCNKAILDYLRVGDIGFTTVLYEKLCSDPAHTVNSVLARLGIESRERFDVLRNRSHIAMGNKEFTTRNSERVRYDSSWYLDDTINLVYLLHGRIRRFSKNLYRS